MYFASFRVVILSKNGGEIERVLRTAAELEDSSFEFELADSPESVSVPLDADSMAIIDGDVSALCGCGRCGAKNVAFITSAERASEIDSAALELADSLWIMPESGKLDERLLKMYFEKFSASVKEKTDARKQKICFETAIDSIPDLVWFKDTAGAHLMVNDGFCKAVEKTKEQIYKRGHYYIWDIPQEEYEQGEYVCLESEDIVMDARKTCLFDEKVKTKSGMRQFKTYKSPLIDENGIIFGTCGIAHDVTDLNNIYTEMMVMFESMPFAVMIEDRDGIILSINSKFGEFFGSEKNVVGKNYSQWKKRALKGKIHRFHGNEDISVRVNGEDRILQFRENPIIDIFNEKIGVIGIFSDITLERRFEEQTLHRANTDFLTGLNNRGSLFNYLDTVKDEPTLSMITVDLDHFKMVNDSYGHHVGDEALKVTSQTMRRCFPDDFIARLGGDEFLIVISGDCSMLQLEEETQNFLDVLAEVYSERLEFGILSASAGIAQAQLDGEEQHDAEYLMRCCDKALYSAKQSGKDRYCVFERKH